MFSLNVNEWYLEIRSLQEYSLRHCDPVDNAEKAFFRYKHKKTTWTLRSYETFENLNQNLAANSYGKLGCPVGNIG